jgi:bifunctional DNA-binding transcriptional regulator/antitoxin component of YhaV-PrlF toxin-antitoxin module
MSQNVVLEDDCRITLPNEVVDQYGLQANMPLRIIETHAGILLIPIPDVPMTESLRAEMEEWQALGRESFLK